MGPIISNKGRKREKRVHDREGKEKETAFLAWGERKEAFTPDGKENV